MNLGKWVSSVAILTALLGGASSANAWTKFKNGTPNTIWVAYAWAAESGFGCGYDDQCSGSGPNGYEVAGWWQIAPGGTTTVNGNAYHNARQQYFAEDNAGHVWDGGGDRFNLDFANAFDYCGGDWQITAGAYFRRISNSTCCGFTCSPVNKTWTLVL